MILFIVTNELQVAEDLINGTYYGALNKRSRIVILAKYYIHISKIKNKEVEMLLHEYSSKDSKMYVWEMNDSFIKSCIRQAKSSGIVSVPYVEIYESEIEQIRKAKNLIKEKILFSFLVHAKVRYSMNEKTNAWVVDNSIDIFKSVEINYTSQRREMLISELVSDCYISLSGSVDKNSRKVEYMALSGKVFARIINFNQLGLQYESLMGISDIVECEACKKLTIRKSNRVKYCRDCYNKSHKQAKLASYHKNKTKILDQ